MGDFYGTGIEIWAGFGPVRQLLRPVFSCFHGQNVFFQFFFSHFSVFTKKLLDTKVKFEKCFLGVKNDFLWLPVLVIIVEGVCPIRLPLVSFIFRQNSQHVHSVTVRPQFVVS